MSNNFGALSQEFNAAEAGLREGEKNLALAINSNNVPKKMQGEIPWLSAGGVQLFNYYDTEVKYMVEQFPDNICIKTADDKTWQRHFYRITAWANLPGDKPTVLQSTYSTAKEADCVPTQQTTLFFIPSARLSWRQLQ